MSKLLRSKYFWIALLILVPFVIIWVMEGLAWAIGTLVAVAFVFLLILAGNNRRRTRYYYYEDDEDEEIVVRRRPYRRPRASSSSSRTRDWYFPPGLRNIHQDGLNELGRRQREELKRTFRRLRR